MSHHVLVNVNGFQKQSKFKKRDESLHDYLVSNFVMVIPIYD